MYFSVRNDIVITSWWFVSEIRTVRSLLLAIFSLSLMNKLIKQSLHFLRINFGLIVFNCKGATCTGILIHMGLHSIIFAYFVIYCENTNHCV